MAYEPLTGDPLGCGGARVRKGNDRLFDRAEVRARLALYPPVFVSESLQQLL
jgi:hypothetical protein